MAFTFSYSQSLSFVFGAAENSIAQKRRVMISRLVPAPGCFSLLHMRTVNYMFSLAKEPLQSFISSLVMMRETETEQPVSTSHLHSDVL